MVPAFTLEPSTGSVPKLRPCSLTTATPQNFTVASRWVTSTNLRVPRPAKAARVRGATQPRSHLPDLSWWLALERRSATGSSRTPFCRLPVPGPSAVPSLSGLLPPSPASPAQVALSFLRQPRLRHLGRVVAVTACVRAA